MNDCLKEVLEGTAPITTEDIMVLSEQDIKDIGTYIDQERPAGAFLLNTMITDLYKRGHTTFYSIRHLYDKRRLEPTYILPNLLYLLGLGVVFFGCLACAIFVPDALCRFINCLMLFFILCGVGYVCNDYGETPEYNIPKSSIYIRQFEVYDSKAKLHIAYSNLQEVSWSNRTIYFAHKSGQITSMCVPPTCINIDAIVKYINSRIK